MILWDWGLHPCFAKSRPLVFPAIKKRNLNLNLRLSLIIKGGSGSSSHELRLTDFKAKRRSDSVIGIKLSKLVAVVYIVNIGGGALAVKARRRSDFVVSISRNSFAVKSGFLVEREGRPRFLVRRPRGDWGDGPPQNLRWGDGPCIGPPQYFEKQCCRMCVKVWTGWKMVVFLWWNGHIRHLT